MKDWQIDAMIGNYDMKLWAEQNAPDPLEDTLLVASVGLFAAIQNMDKAIEHLMFVKDDLRGTPMEDKIVSFVDEIENTKVALKGLYDKFSTGRRE